jgi:apolipoprotein N-acyltransferase
LHALIADDSPLRTFRLRLAACGVSGLFLVACFPLVSWHLLVWLAIAPLLVALTAERSRKRGFLLGYLAGAIFLAGCCHWFVDVMRLHGGLSPLLAWGVLALFVIVFAVFFGGFGMVVCWAARRSRRRPLLLAPFLWVAMEIARTYLLTGVPWNLLGYAVEANGLRHLASVSGVYGLSFLAATYSALLAWVWIEPRRVAPRLSLVGWSVLLIGVNVVLTPPPLPSGARTAHLIQPNIPMTVSEIVKWAPWQNPTPLNGLVETSIASVRRQGTPAGASLIIWPENPAPFYFERDPIFRTAAERMAREAGAYVVVGSVNYADPQFQQPKNSAVVLDPEGRVVLAYDKIHLVPFGEYVPWWALPGLVGKITHEAGNFVPGTSYRAAETRDGTLSLFICYEAIFPQLVRRLVTESPGVLVNISNDAWFGDSAAAAQHLEMARLRAIENRRYLLRATNDGITCVIDPYGRIVNRLPRHQQAVLVGQFEFVAGKTFYTEYGDVFAWACTGIAILILVHAAAKQA